MKRTLLIIVTVLALIAGTYFADRATRVHPKVSVTVKVDNPAARTSSAALAIAPDFTLKDLDDKDLSLSQFKGKVVLLNFWATWCEPCRVEIPWLIDMQQKYSARGFTIIGIAMDEEGKTEVAPYVAKERFNVSGQQLPMSYPIVLGNDPMAEKFGGLLGYPTSILISRDGKVVKRITGLISYDEMASAIEAQL
jgi:thiol-disulfide isomerase/thioredoxin